MLTITSATRQNVATLDTVGDNWAQLWFTLVRRSWSSLAIVPATPRLSAFAFAQRLAEVARAYEDGYLDVLDAEGATPGEVGVVLTAFGARAAAGARVLVAVSSPLTHPPAIPLARASDVALLAVPLGNTRLVEARRTLAAIGPEYFIGSVTVRGT